MEPPAAKGTTKRMGFEGQTSLPWAWASMAPQVAINTAAMLMILPNFVITFTVMSFRVGLICPTHRRRVALHHARLRRRGQSAR